MYDIKGNSGGIRSKRKPRKIWLRDVTEDLNEMRIRTWRRKAQDRK